MDIKGLFAATANALYFLDAYAFLRRKITKSQVAILTYHRVCPEIESWYSVPMSPQALEQQIRYIRRHFEVIPLDELVRYIRRRNTLPEKSIAISFDDGYRDIYTYAYPILKKYSIPATIFLTTGNITDRSLFWWDKVGYSIQNTKNTQFSLDEIGKFFIQPKSNKYRTNYLVVDRLKELPEERRNFLVNKLIEQCQVNISPDLGRELMLTWDEIKEMNNNGISFGAHSVNHQFLTKIPLELAKYEIRQSKRDIEENLGVKVTAFAYPFGDCNPELVNFVKETGYKYAVSVSQGKLISVKDDTYKLPRILSTQKFSKFKTMLCGLWGDWVTVFPVRK
jgi:peptidoglycan/xylan/chitin deacetylase (PgdA/CDA1 family)